MNFLEKLSFLMERSNENPHTFAQRSGIPYTTINGFYKKGYSNMKLSTLMSISEYYNVALDYLVKDSIDDPDFGKYSAINEDEMKLIKKYRTLNVDGQLHIKQSVDNAVQNPVMQKSDHFDKATS